MKRTILFHICCGPCSTTSIEQLNEDGFEPIGYYYNPNIYPESEYRKRLREAKKFAEGKGIRFIVPKYNNKEYDDVVRGSEKCKADRCRKCWHLRLEKTARMARKLGLKNFGTSLRISPYQNQEDLLSLAQKIADKYNLNFYDLDLVNRYQDSVKISKELGMYRQKYCGCKYSKDYI